MKAFDTITQLTYQQLLEIKALGYGAIGIYMRSDRTPPSYIAQIRKAGLKMFLIYEKGNPTSKEYFTKEQALSDAKNAVVWAIANGFNKGAIINTADYDCYWQDLDGYIQTFHDFIRKQGFLTGLYSGGDCIAHWQDAGYVHYGMLSESSSFPGWQNYKPRAAIIQTMTHSVNGVMIDEDVINDLTVLVS